MVNDVIGLCAHCGAKNATGAHSCRSCGQPIEPSDPPKRNWRRIIPAVAIGLVVAMTVMTALNVLSNDVLSIEAFGPAGLAVGGAITYLIIRRGSRAP